MSKSVRACLKLCEELLSRGYGPEMKMVVSDYRTFFRNHQALMDAVSLDPVNAKGMVTAVQNKIAEDFNRKCDQEDEEGRFKPILVKELIPEGAFKGLSILDEGVKDALEGWKIYYYSMSFFITWERLPRYAWPFRYKIADTMEEARKIFDESWEQRKRELELLSGKGEQR